MSDPSRNTEDLVKMVKDKRRKGEYADAAKILRGHIAELERSICTTDPESRPSIAYQLADLHGMLGGTLREQGNLVGATQAYDAGFRYESDPRNGVLSSYNALNRLLTRIFICPNSVSDAKKLRAEPGLDFVDVPREVADLRAKLEGEVGGRRSKDIWALGDLALLCVLTGDDEAAAHVAERFRSLLPPNYARETYLRSTRELATLDTPFKHTLERLSTYLIAP